MSSTVSFGGLPAGQPHCFQYKQFSLAQIQTEPHVTGLAFCDCRVKELGVWHVEFGKRAKQKKEPGVSQPLDP